MSVISVARSSVTLCAVFAACVGAVPAAAAAEAGASDPSVLARIAEARPLDDVRVGISEQEPEYCTAQISRETNPGAANRASIEVGPPKFLVGDLSPSSIWRHCVSIHNRSPDARTVTIEALDVLGSLDPQVRLETRSDPDGVGSWLSFPLTEVQLEPGERVLVPYLLEVPAEPPGGTSTAGISVADATGRDETGGGARITRSLIAQLQVTFPGGAPKPIEATDLTSPRLVWSGRDLDVATFGFVASNVGSIVDTIEPEIGIEGLAGRSIETLSTTPEVLVPGSAQQFTLRWTDLPWIGVYRPTLVIESAAETTRIEYPRIWILPPWPFILALGAAIALFVYGLVRRRRAPAEHGEWDDDGYDAVDPDPDGGDAWQ